MRIDSVHIDGFGKFNNEGFEFQKGINIIYGLNEAGKSTLQSFIKAMLFSPRSIKASDYLKRYEPWKDGQFSGKIQYSLEDGERYRVERNFRNGDIRIYNRTFKEVSDTFQISREKGPLFAREHLGMDEAIFEKTVYVKQMETKLSSDAKKALVEKAVNILNTGEEDVSIDNLITELNENLKAYVGNNRTKIKPYEQLKNEISKLEDQKSQLLKQREGMFSKTSFGRAEEMDKHARDCRDILDRAIEINRLIDEVEVLKEKKYLNKKIYESIRIRDDYQDKYLSGLMGELELCKGSIAEKGARISLMEIELEKTRMFAQKAEAYRTEIESFLNRSSGSQTKFTLKKFFQKRSDVILPVFFAGVLYLVSKALSLSDVFDTVFLTFMIVYPVIKLFVNSILDQDLKGSKARISEIFQELGLKDAKEYFYHTSLFENKLKDYELLNEEIMREEVRMETIQEDIRQAILSQADQRNREKEESSISDGNEQVGEKQADSLKNAEEIEGEISRLDREIAETLKVLEEKMDLFRMVGEELKTYAEEIEEVLLSDVLSKNEKEKAFLKELDRLNTLLEEKTRKQLNYELTVKEIEEIDRQLENIDAELAEKTEKKKRLEGINFSLNKAIEKLKESSEIIKSSALPSVTRNFARFAKEFTGEKYRDIGIDDKYDIKALEGEVQKIIDAGFLSGGTLEQLYLAFRLAVAEAMTGNAQKVPIILDEVFAYFDDERTKKCFKLLQKLAKVRQVIIFTCKSREIELATEVFGESYNYIEL